MNDDRPATTNSVSGSGRSSRLVWCGAALVVGTCATIGFLAWRSFGHRQPSPLAEPASDVAREANEYLREQKAEPLSGSLQSLLADPGKKLIATKPHPLLNQYAPPFALNGVDGKRVELEDLLTRGPVVLVFYFGYSCDHCVAQLFGINKDLRYFSELKATVVAISPDTPERTRERYAEYGAFNFPVLSDGDRAVASRYGVYRPATDGLTQWQAHGTFVIGIDRYVRWVNTGPLPFTDNATLLHELARISNLLPETK